MTDKKATADGKVPPLLRKLALGCGIATSYLNWRNRRVTAETVTLVRLVNALCGSHLADDPGKPELTALYKLLRDARRKQALPAVLVAWDGEMSATWMWTKPGKRRFSLLLQPEDGTAAPLEKPIPCDATVRRKGGHARVRLRWKHKIPFGYYHLAVNVDGKELCRALLISAPRKLRPAARDWGLFLPVYALRAGTDYGIGGYRELKEAAAFVKKQGGSFVSTLPLLAGTYEGPQADRSPYAPTSRLFWNEIFLDPDTLPGAPPASKLGRGAKKPGKGEALVDYARAYEVKKEMLARAAESFFSNGLDKEEDYRIFLAQYPLLEDYARFRSEESSSRDKEAVARFHRYVQYACHKQLQGFRDGSARDLAELNLDYPVGVHTRGFDAHQFPALFMDGVGVGAPPDMLFSGGQSWGFRPFHPRRFERDRFRYFRATLHNYFRYARRLRLDHIMGLYRLYCIPDGVPAGKGAYLHYPLAAFMAILCLEAHRHDGILIGEDLGTVPGLVRRSMATHGISRMWVAQLEMKNTPEKTFRGIGANMIASLNTHDLFPFRAYMEGADLGTLEGLGLLKDAEAKELAGERHAMLAAWRGRGDPLTQALKHLAASKARHIIVNMEDLWRERKPQNIPGTLDEYPNWRRRFPYPVTAWTRQKAVRAALPVLNRRRTR